MAGTTGPWTPPTARCPAPRAPPASHRAGRPAEAPLPGSGAEQQSPPQNIGGGATPQDRGEVTHPKLADPSLIRRFRRRVGTDLTGRTCGGPIVGRRAGVRRGERTTRPN